MTRRQRIADLTTFALPSQPALSPDGARGRVRAHHRRRRRRQERVTVLWRGGRGQAGSGAAADQGHGGRRPRLVAGRHQDRVPARRRRCLPSAGCCPPAAASPSSSPRCRSARARPSGRPTGPRSRSARPSTCTAMPGEDDAARARRATAPVVDHPARLQGRRRGAAAHHPQAPARPRPRQRQVRQVTEGDWHAGDPVWSPDSARLAFGAATAPDADLRYRAPVYTVDVSGGFAQAARRSRSPTGSARPPPGHRTGPR